MKQHTFCVINLTKALAPKVSSCPFGKSFIGLTYNKLKEFVGKIFMKFISKTKIPGLTYHVFKDVVGEIFTLLDNINDLEMFQ